MKKTWKYLIAAAVLLTAAGAVTGCSQWDPVYEQMDEEGYTVSVRFDANGGAFANRDGVSIVDVFRVSDYKTNAAGMAEIKVLDPADPARQQVGDYSASRTGYFLAGWYKTRTLRVNESGEALDDYGVPVSVSGREQGYTYADKWDFETDRLTVDPNGDYSAFDEQMTLYAAWIPKFTFEFYAPDENGQFALVAKDSNIVLEMPAWNESTGQLDMGGVPKREGMTFEAAYYDEAMTKPVTEATLTGNVDLEHGVAHETTIKLYTTWQEGVWFRIYDAKQFISNSRLGGNYILYADLDFEGKFWSSALATGVFTGTIEGNGHTIKNITFTQPDASSQNGGLFGVLGGRSVIRNVTFENITYVLSSGSRMPDPTFGLLAGTLTEGATLENVSVSGTLKIGSGVIPPDKGDYSIGLLFGVGSSAGVSHESITCVPEDPEGCPIKIAVDGESGEVTLTFPQ